MNAGKLRRNILIRTTKLLIVILVLLFILSSEAFLINKIRQHGARTFVCNVKTDLLTNILNHSLPIVEATCDATRALTTMRQAKKFAQNILGWNFEDPNSIVKSQSAVLSSVEIENESIAIPSKAKDDNDIDNPQPRDVKQIVPIHEERKTSSDGKVHVRDETGSQINVDKILSEPLKMTNRKDGPRVLIYHTHTTESYVPTLEQIGDADTPSRQRNPAYNVVRVGEELAQILRNRYNIGVIHNGTVHTYPSDIGAYKRSLTTAINILRDYPSISIVLDIHRDGLGGANGKLRTVTTLNGTSVARIMMVVGTDSTGLSHPNWRENLKLAIKIQNLLLKQNPNLVKPIHISKNRYNQHIKPGALLMEIGGDGNLLSEALESTKYIAKAIDEILNSRCK